MTHYLRVLLAASVVSSMCVRSALSAIGLRTMGFVSSVRCQRVLSAAQLQASVSNVSQVSISMRSLSCALLAQALA